MSFADYVKSTMQGPFRISNNRVNPFEILKFDTLGAATGNNYFVIRPSFINAIKTLQAIRDNMVTGAKMLVCPIFNSFFGKNYYLAKAYCNRIPFRIYGYR